ncbi:two-component system response regulator YesN [Neobacillus niacini]|uniref:response regulator transcription factor n=1 Tax=Neobacillus niacini TaxID=86668 RepID=UPI00277DC49C|nr:response regulator [Neobacillus niacini]MDQ1004627.1 two-component system response regulator YesN [Neobacillus niacini]
MGYKVVIADDEKLILKNLAQIIDWQGLDCEIIGTAQNGQEVMGIIENQQADLLLTDISMPEMSGIELLKTLNQIDNKPMVILISGYDDFEYAKEAIKNNAFDYILKPIDYDELEDCVKRALNKLKEQKVSVYRHEKNAIYELITSGKVDAQINNKQAFYFSMILKNYKEDIELILTKSKDFLSKWNANLFVYTLSDREVMVVVEMAKHFINQAVDITDAFSQQLFHAGSDQCIISVGKVVEQLFEIKHSVDAAKELLKYDNYITGNILTEERLKKEYKPSQSAADMMEEALDYIRNNFQTDLGMEQIAEHVGLSVSYFSLLFKQKTGLTFLDYLTNVRMEYACLFLQNTDLKTYEIAEKVGYTDQRYFSQVFKRKMKKTPSEYRKLVKNNEASPY